MALSKILPSVQGLMSKFFNPAFHHLIYPMGIFIKIFLPPFFE
jgi:hypothetical protein